MKLKFIKTLATLAIGIASLSTNAQAACSLSAIAGNWGISGQGTHVLAGNTGYSFIGNFTFLASGATPGTGTGFGTLSIAENGVVYANLPQKVTSIVVDSTTCKGTLLMMDGSGLLQSFTFMILNGGLELSLMNNDGKHVGIITAKRAF